MIPDRLAAALADRYRLERELGEGGMATVYLAEDLKHHRQVAIKVLKPQLAQVLGAERFLREIEIAAGLTHPHILPVHDSGEVGGFLYYVMPYIEGESLRDRVAREGELPISEALRILRDVVDALTHAHERGVVHRDMKPDNVLLTDRHALVTDFGVAKAVSEATGDTSLTETGMAVGTPAYMAPEQAVADPKVDHRADLYAVGVLAYEMLAGRPPFTEPTPQALLAAHVTQEPDPLARHRPTVPESVSAAVMRCLAKKPADRWQTARELLAQLEAVITPVTGTAPAEPRDVPALSRKRRALGMAAVAGVAVGVLAYVLLAGDDGEGVAASARRIAVIPFAPASPDTALARLGRDLVVTVSAGLDGVGDVTTADPSTILAQTRARTDLRTVDEAVELGRSLGSASVLHGNLLRSGDRVRIEASLVGTTEGHVLARVSVTGPLDDVGALTDSLTWALLGAVWPGERLPTRALQGITTRSLPALRAFLEGEHAAVDDRWPEAAEAYLRAIEADSTFWLAYRRYARARGWFGGSVDSVLWARLLEHRDELPPRERALFEAGDATDLADRLSRLEDVIRRFPDYWPAWFEYADRLVHVAPLVGYTRADAQAALERTLALNPQFVSAWDHLYWATVNREPAVAGRALEAMRRFEHDSTGAFSRTRMYALGARIDSVPAPEARPWADSVARMVMAETGESPPQIALLLASFSLRLDLPRAQIRVSRAVLEQANALGSRDEALHRWLAARAWMMRGDWDSVLTAMDVVASRLRSPDAALEPYAAAVFGAWLGALEPEEARARRGAAERAIADGDGEPPRSGPGLSVAAARQYLPSDRAGYLYWLDGVLAAAEGDTAALEAAAVAIGQSDVEDVDLLARSLTGLAQGLRGDRAAGAATLAAVEADRAASSRGDTRARAENDRYLYLHEVNRLQAGRWFVATGDTARAARILTWHENLNFPSPAAGIAYLERARIENARGHPELARAYYEQFLRLYDRPMEAHAHLVREAQEALARLAGVEEIGGP